MPIRFGVYQFDPDTGDLRRDGRPVRLQPQPARMLAALLAQPGEIVTRESLQHAIWGHDTHVDFERGLNFCAAQIRGALRDSASSPRFIETVPRRGYRFIAPVSQPLVEAGRPIQKELPPDPELPPAMELPPEGGSHKTPHSRLLPRSWLPPLGGRLAASAALLAIAIAAAVLLARGTMASPPRIAVVPFDNETGSPDFDRIAKGVSDATVARLTTPERLPRFGVIGNAAVLRFTFVPRDLKAMGDTLGAEYIVLGQVKRDERGFRIVAHLIRVSDQTHVWASTFDRGALDLAEQSAIAEAIAQAVTDHVGRG
jgi:TolB-like protein/DNA-binding winged helix-turn-helix (wHTH) protein